MFAYGDVIVGVFFQILMGYAFTQTAIKTQTANVAP